MRGCWKFGTGKTILRWIQRIRLKHLLVEVEGCCVRSRIVISVDWAKDHQLKVGFGYWLLLAGVSILLSCWNLLCFDICFFGMREYGKVKARGEACEFGIDYSIYSFHGQSWFLESIVEISAIWRGPTWSIGLLDLVVVWYMNDMDAIVLFTISGWKSSLDEV